MKILSSVNKLFLSILLLIFIQKLYANDSLFISKLQEIPEIVSVEKIDNHSQFKEAYVVFFEQMLDHNHPEAGSFHQRLVISVADENSPVVFVTEGYGAGYALRSSYLNELSEILQANQVVVEHRFFGESFPDSQQWEYLNIKDAADDLHHIYNTLKNLFVSDKWVATGISKGGQNTLAYKAFYPDDMKAWIPYVGPVNFAKEDKRMEKFIQKVSSRSDREKVYQFQLDILQNRKQIQPLLDSLIHANNYTYHISNDMVLDYTVLEYSFAFWQWGSDVSNISSPSSDISEKFNHLVKTSSPDYFAIEGIAPIKTFFVQTLRDFGYYGYRTREFEPYLVIDDAENYMKEVFIPDVPEFHFNNKTSRYIKRAINKDGEHVLMIYGEYDPWTAGALSPCISSKAMRFIKEGGSHRTRIKNMPREQADTIKALLFQWLN